MELFAIVVMLQVVSGLQVYLADKENNGLAHQVSRVKRLFISSRTNLWTNGVVPYIFDSITLDRQQEYLEKVFPVYEKYSCIKFVTWTNKTKEDYNLDHNNYLIFVNTNQCSSTPGNTRKTGQSISCCYWKTCLHELGHALGLKHEHTSPIRDQFVRINYKNIIDAGISQFSKNMNTNSYGIYDYNSIMHYAQKAWNINGEPTITFLEPDNTETSNFADKERYYYLFMEINEAYQCAAHCDKTCVNGGYKASVKGKCACRCPEGLDSKNSCKTLLNKDYTCGDIIDLTDQNRTTKFESPEIRGVSKPTTCYWFIKSPENTRIQMDFPHFKIRKQDGECVDEVGVGYYLPGLYGHQYCGNVFKQTVQSESNIIALSFTQTPSTGSISEFDATATFIHEDAYCYSSMDSEYSYNGKVNYAVESTPCLYWDDVTHCQYHLFNVKDADKNLAMNYCRNPDKTKTPWCYVKSEGCIRNVCDACNFGMCKDLRSNCDKLIGNDPMYCNSNTDAPRDCRSSCGHCDNHKQLSSVKTMLCSAPVLPSDAKEMVLNETYIVGEKVNIQCNSSSDTQDITCLSDGNWTSLKFVCGTCESGWLKFGSNCYKLFTALKKQSAAELICNAQCNGCSLLRENKWNHDFVTSLIKNIGGLCTPVWTGLTRVDDTSLYSWNDGNTDLKWTNWADETTPSGLGCVGINMNCVWKDKTCGTRQKFICQYVSSVPLLCANQISGCGKLLQRNPDFCKKHKWFAQTKCPKKCDLCPY